MRARRKPLWTSPLPADPPTGAQVVGHGREVLALVSTPAALGDEGGFPPASWDGLAVQRPWRAGGIVAEADEAAVIEEVPAWAAGWTPCTPASRGGSPAPSHAGGCWPTCAGCSATWGARTAGNWPSTPASAPRWMQRSLATADWDPDLVRDDLRGCVVEQLGDPGGVLVADETGFLKKGTTSVGVERQYSAPPARSTTARWASFWPMPAPRGGRSLTGSCTCPAVGPTILPGAGPPGSLRRSGSRPSRSWPGSCWSAPWRLGCRLRG